MIEVIKSETRGRGRHGWLNSFHSFSFANYYNPARMGFSDLRVINDDTVTPGKGFGIHGHRDMEIISYVLEGRIAHKDSQGNVKKLPAGEFQLMSAGRGVTHSEFNASNKEPLHFLQIWIEPDVRGGTPGYQQKDFGRKWGLTKVITPTGEGGTLKIKQDASLYQLLMRPGQTETLSLEQGRKAYIHLIDGELELPGHTLGAGDGAQITKLSQLEMIAKGSDNLRALVFDLA
jgi:redox-sensitive bicupin YhaK (pirin superfamily)